MAPNSIAALRGGSTTHDLAVKYDAKFEEENQIVDVTKQHTEKIIERIHAMMKCYGDYTSSSMNKPEALSDAVNRLGQRLPQGNTYSTALLCCAAIEKNLGAMQRKLHRDVEQHVVMPLQDWIKGDCHEIMRARDDLRKKRNQMDDIQAKLEKSGKGDKAATLKQTHIIAKKAHEDAKKVMDEWLIKMADFHRHHQQCIQLFAKLLHDYNLEAFELSDRYTKHCDTQ